MPCRTLHECNRKGVVNVLHGVCLILDDIIFGQYCCFIKNGILLSYWQGRKAKHQQKKTQAIRMKA